MSPDMLKKPMIMCAAAMPVTPEILIKALMWAGLTWHMTTAQVMAMESNALQHAVELQSAQVLQELSPFVGERTLMGIPIMLDSDLPHSVIELWLEGKAIFRIESLAIPSGTPWNYPG